MAKSLCIECEDVPAIGKTGFCSKRVRGGVGQAGGGDARLCRLREVWHPDC